MWGRAPACLAVPGVACRRVIYNNYLMTRIKIVILSILSFLILTACFEGYTSSDGGHLKVYMPPDTMKELLEKNNREIMVIDVRPFNAYEKGHLPGAVSMPSSEIKNHLSEIEKNRDVILYCETGGRAQQVIKYLEEEGYSRLMNWGGYTRWEWDYTQGIYP